MVGVDSHSPTTILTNKDHFKDHKLKQIGEWIGIGIGLTEAGMGNITMNIEDDNGRIHTIEISNSLYIQGL